MIQLVKVIPRRIFTSLMVHQNKQRELHLYKIHTILGKIRKLNGKIVGTRLPFLIYGKKTHRLVNITL